MQRRKSEFYPPAISGDGKSGNGFIQEGQVMAIPPTASMPNGLKRIRITLGHKHLSNLRRLQFLSVYETSDALFQRQVGAHARRDRKQNPDRYKDVHSQEGARTLPNRTH
jgi:hypothetical protein